MRDVECGLLRQLWYFTEVATLCMEDGLQPHHSFPFLVPVACQIKGDALLSLRDPISFKDRLLSCIHILLKLEVASPSPWLVLQGTPVAKGYWFRTTNVAEAYVGEHALTTIPQTPMSLKPSTLKPWNSTCLSVESSSILVRRKPISGQTSDDYCSQELLRVELKGLSVD